MTTQDRLHARRRHRPGAATDLGRRRPLHTDVRLHMGREGETWVPRAVNRNGTPTTRTDPWSQLTMITQEHSVFHLSHDVVTSILRVPNDKENEGCMSAHSRAAPPADKYTIERLPTGTPVKAVFDSSRTRLARRSKAPEAKSEAGGRMQRSASSAKRTQRQFQPSLRRTTPSSTSGKRQAQS